MLFCGGGATTAEPSSSPTITDSPTGSPQPTASALSVGTFEALQTSWLAGEPWVVISVGYLLCPTMLSIVSDISIIRIEGGGCVDGRTTLDANQTVAYLPWCKGNFSWKTSTS